MSCKCYLISKRLLKRLETIHVLCYESGQENKINLYIRFTPPSRVFFFLSLFPSEVSNYRF